MEAKKKIKGGLRLVSVKELSNILGNETFSEPAIRHLIFNAEDRFSASGEVIPSNGLASSILRIGSRLLLDLDSFYVWLETHRQAPS